MKEDKSTSITDIEVAKKLINIFQSSQDRKLEFNLSFEYVKKLLEYKTCYYTNKTFTEEGAFSRSFDRVDSDLGYIEGNVVACTIDINGKKSNLSLDEINLLHYKLNKAKVKNKPFKKILVIGNGRHGKDSFAEILNSEINLSYSSSSETANDLFIFHSIKDKYDYKNKKECFNDRVNHREEWYDLICEYNKDDKAKLAKKIISKKDCYVGMRDYDEFKESKNLFDIIVYVDASERVKEIDSSFKIPKEEADIIIENNTTFEDFKSKVIKFSEIIKND